MPSTIYPSDSPSQVSTVRASAHGHQQARGDGSRGSMLGRAPPVTRESGHGGNNGNGDNSRGSVLGRNHSKNASTISGAGQHHSSGGHKDRSSSNLLYNPARKANMQSMGRIEEEDTAQVISGPPRSNLTEHNVNHINGYYGDRQPSGSAIVPSEHMSQQRQRNMTAQRIPHNEVDQNREKRFVTLTWSTIEEDLVLGLRRLFKVQTSKVKDWVTDGLIRIDLQNLRNNEIPYNVDPLLEQSAPKDIERWDERVKAWENRRDFYDAANAMHGSRRGSFMDYDGGLYGR